MVKGVMFDFSGTLFRIESVGEWLRAVVGRPKENQGLEDLGEDELRALAARLEEFGALPGGTPPRELPADLTELWQARDLSAAQHRAAYTALARRAGLPSRELADALYERHMEPDAWRPYPDTASTLEHLRRLGLPVAVVSNIGWDLRTVFRAHGVDHLVDAYLLSFECGVHKPDPGIFQAACDRLGLPPGEVLMVGDDRSADGGAAALGCPVHLVDHLPVDRRPAALTAIVNELALQGNPVDGSSGVPGH